MKSRISLKWVLAGVIALTIFGGAEDALAGYRISYEAVSYSDEVEPDQVISRQKNALLIDQGKMRTVGGDLAGFDLIADIAANRIYVLDATQQAYALIDFPALEPDTPADTAAATADSAAPVPSDLLVSVADTSDPILKYPTRMYSIFEDSTLIRELWTTEELNLGFDFMRAMDGLERAFQKFAPAEDYQEIASIFRKVRGVPLKDIQYYPAGRDTLQAVKVEKIKFAAGEFSPPSNYVQRNLKNLAEGGGEETNAP